LYDRQSSIDTDKVLDRVALQRETFGTEKNLPDKLFKVYDECDKGLQALEGKYGAVVKPDQLAAG
jgi:hypothetical protein